MHRETLRLRRQALGGEHPDTLASMNNLALALSKAGKRIEAAEMHRATLLVQRRVLGEDHPHTLTSLKNAQKYDKAGGSSAALPASAALAAAAAGEGTTLEAAAPSFSNVAHAMDGLMSRLRYANADGLD